MDLLNSLRGGNKGKNTKSQNSSFLEATKTAAQAALLLGAVGSAQALEGNKTGVFDEYKSLNELLIGSGIGLEKKATSFDVLKEGTKFAGQKYKGTYEQNFFLLNEFKQTPSLILGYTETTTVDREIKEEKLPELGKGDIEETTVTTGSSLVITSRDEDTTTKASFTPSEDTVEAKVSKEDSNSRIEVTILSEINNTNNDYRLRASYAALYSAAKLGTYIGIEKGSEFEKLVLTEGIKVEGGKVKVSYALLKRVVETTFSATGTTHTPKMSQNTFGLEYSKINVSEFVKELKGSLVYYNVDNVNLGVIGDTIINNASEYDWTRIHGGLRGGNTLLAKVTATLKASDTVKVDLSAGYESTKYNSMFNTASNSTSGIIAGLDFAYQPDNHNKIDLSYNTSKASNGLGVKYTHDFGNNLRGFVGGEKVNYKDSGINDDNRIQAGLTWGGNNNKSKFSDLFSELRDRTTLSIDDLTPSSDVNTDTIQVMDQTSWNEHMLNIDKTAIPAGTTVDPITKDLTLIGLNAFSTFTSATKNGFATSVAPFVIGGTTLTIDISALDEPTAGDDTYVLTTDGAPANTITIVVGRGSIVIKTITVAAGTTNDAPVPTYTSASTAEDTPLNGTLTATDTENDSLTFAKVTDPANGTVTVNANGTYTYTPNANYNGGDTFTYSVTDGTSTVNQTVTLTVGAVNDAPVPTYTSASTAEDTPLNGTLTATDTENDSLTFAKVTDPANGTVTVNANGTYTYTPNANYNGGDTFTYSVTDGTSTVNQTVTLTVGAVNDAPTSTTISPDSVNEGAAYTYDVSANFDDLDNDTLVYGISGAPAGFTINASGVISGTAPLITTATTYDITVTASDGVAPATQQIYTLTINDLALASAPTGLDLATASDLGTSNSDNITSDNTPTINWNALVGVTGYKISYDNGTSRLDIGNVVTYTSGALTDGVKNIKVRGYNAAGDGPATAALTVTIDKVAPVLSSTTQTFTTPVGTPLTLVTVTSNDAVDGIGTVVQSGDTVDFNIIGTYNVIYTATDTAGNSSSITHTYTVNAIDTAPTIGSISYVDNNGNSITQGDIISLSASIADENLATVTWRVIERSTDGGVGGGSGGAIGTVLATGTGQFTGFDYTIGAGQYLQLTVELEATDENGNVTSVNIIDQDIL